MHVRTIEKTEFKSVKQTAETGRQGTYNIETQMFVNYKSTNVQSTVSTISISNQSIKINSSRNHSIDINATIDNDIDASPLKYVPGTILSVNETKRESSSSHESLYTVNTTNIILRMILIMKMN